MCCIALCVCVVSGTSSHPKESFVVLHTLCVMALLPKASLFPIYARKMFLLFVSYMKHLGDHTSALLMSHHWQSPPSPNCTFLSFLLWDLELFGELIIVRYWSLLQKNTCESYYRHNHVRIDKDKEGLMEHSWFHKNLVILSQIPLTKFA